MASSAEPKIRHEATANRFVLELDAVDAQALLEYIPEANGTVFNVTHTEVPVAMRGRGIGGQLVRAVCVHARTRGIKLIPTCSYVAHYFNKNPSDRDVMQKTE